MSVENNQRRKYDKEFKVEAIRLLKESGKTIKEVAENLGIYYGNLSK
jgi:transposase-like protein